MIINYVYFTVSLTHTCEIKFKTLKDKGINFIKSRTNVNSTNLDDPYYYISCNVNMIKFMYD